MNINIFFKSDKFPWIKLSFQLILNLQKSSQLIPAESNEALEMLAFLGGPKIYIFRLQASSLFGYQQ